MTFELLIARYGLVAVFLGAGIEGETAVLLAGVLAHQGFLPPFGVAIAAAIGSCLVDQLWFLLGRRFRNQRRVETIKQRPAFTKAQRILERHPKSFIFFFRFLYGLRTVSPIAIGLSNIPSRMFVPLNILAAVIWGSLFTLIGYYLGMAVEPLLHDFKSILIICIALVLIGMLALFTLRHIRAKKMQV